LRVESANQSDSIPSVILKEEPRELSETTLENEPPLFAALQRAEERAATGEGTGDGTAVQLCFDDNGAYLQVVDGKGCLRDIDYHATRGAFRDLLKAMALIKRRQQDLVGWDGDAERIYLHHHEHLLWPLRNCAVLVGEDLKPLAFVQERAEIVFDLAVDPARTPPWLTGQLLLVRDGETVARDGEFRFLNENHVLEGCHIHETPPVGENFRRLAMFASAFPETMLERCLSLLFSHFTGVTVRYPGYAAASGEPLHARASILFQNVDDSGDLHFDLIHTLPGFPVDFTRKYDITRVALINEAQKAIVVREVLYGSLDKERQELNRTLSRHQKELGVNAETILFADEHGFIAGKDLAGRFLSRELSDLARRFVLLGAEKLRPYRIKPVVPKLKLKLGFGIEFLDGAADLEIEGQTFSLMEVLAQHRKSSYITLSDGTQAVMNAEYLAKLARLFRKHEEGVRVSFFDLPLIEEIIDRNTVETQFSKARQVFLGFNSLADEELPAPPIAADLRPYQMSGLKWLDYLHTHGLGGCLADDMGLGKTVQTIALLSRVYPAETTPSLLVMPRSLLFNWQREVERFCPALRCSVFHGASRDLEAAMRSHLVLTTYGTLRGSIEQFLERQFYYVILDESQAIKNSDTQTSKAVLLLKAQRRLALSGTPIENHLGELFSLFRFLNPAMFGSEAEFNRHYAVPIHQHDDKEAARELRRKIYPFILRRLKRDVLKDLPDKIEQTLYVDMSVEQRRLYDARRRFYHETIKRRIADEGMHASRFFILEALLELRQVATIPEEKSEGAIASPKREMLVESVQDAVLNGHKVLVFTNFLAAVELLSADLDQRGIGHLTMTGATGNRENLVRQFQTRDDLKVFIMTLKTGGLGLNLTAADTVFIFDPWWNTAAEAQAVDRTHRIGQDRTVFTYRLIVRDSVEEKIVQLQERKKQLFDSVIASDGVALKSLTEADVDDILG
jgi:superfamily II DNA or RNA helicase